MLCVKYLLKEASETNFIDLDYNDWKGRKKRKRGEGRLIIQVKQRKGRKGS